MNTRSILSTAALAAAFALAGCGGAGNSDSGSDDAAEADASAAAENDYTGGLEPVPAQEIVAAIEQGMSWCTEYRASDASCTNVQTFARRNSDGVVLRALFGAPNQSKVVVDVPATITDGQLCIIQNRDTFADASVFYTSNDRGTVTSDDQRVEPQVLADFLQAISTEQPETDERHCWEYFRSAAPSEGLREEIIMGYYIDGVLQPFRPEEDRGIMVNNDSNRLAIREDE